METEIVCTHCNHRHPFAGELPVGRKANCAKCKESFVVTAASRGPSVTTNQSNQAMPMPTLHIEPNSSETSTVQTTASNVTYTGSASETLSDVFKILLYVGFVVAVAFFWLISNIEGYEFERFKDDNAYGATANSLEKIEKHLSFLRGLVTFIAIAIVWVKFHEWIMSKPSIAAK